MGQSTLAAALDKARRRNRVHIKRSAVSDIAAEQEAEMRRKARRCPMSGCGVRLTDKPNLPNSKHLDHIIPINQGGTHTHGNVRIICRTCNLARPKDGRDYSGPVTLWALGEVPVKRPRKKPVIVRTTCVKGLHSWTPENIKIVKGRQRCAACYRDAIKARTKRRGAQRKTAVCKCGAAFAAPGRTMMCPACTDAAGRKAAELHAAGATWTEAAAAVGYGSHNGEGARYAAKRIGYVPPPVVAAGKPVSLCRCGATAGPRGRCRDCLDMLAVRAARLHADGWKMRQIAAELGYYDASGVRKLLMKAAMADI